MICEITVKAFCKDFTKIENYEKAVADTKTWHYHHRLETHNSDGERRLVDISRDELKALEMYFDRPSEELLFMTPSEHGRLHMKDKKLSKETKQKLSDSHKGQTPVWKGKHLSEEHKEKLSDSMKGNTWNKGRYKGKHWKLVDGKRVWY